MEDLSTVKPQASPRPLTAWARKYGRFSPTSHKSGFTPTAYKFATLGPTYQEPSKKYEEYQKKKLNGFTTRELGQLDCLPTRELTPGNLQNYILPMLQRENWETKPLQPDFLRSALYPLKDGNGMWSAHNDVVWNILQPILILASRILSSVYLLPWFDALLRAPRKPVPKNRLKPGDQDRDDLTFIQPREILEYHLSVASTADRDRAFHVLQNDYHYTFAFMRQDENPMDPNDDPPGAVLGITSSNDLYMQYDASPDKVPRLYTWLSIKEFEFLLRDDLNSAERMSIEWSIANTITHEAMHAVDFLFTDFQGNYGATEPYYDQEPLCELGFSFEQAVNLGSTIPMIDEKDPAIMPLGWFFSRNWPTVGDIPMADPETAELINPGVRLFDEFFPIPVSFYQDVQQEDFWAVGVQKYGHGLLHYRTRKEGARVINIIDPQTGKLGSRNPVRFAAFDQTFLEVTHKFISKVNVLSVAFSLTPQDKRAMQFGRALLHSSQAEQVYWDSTASQQALVKTAVDVMASASSYDPTPTNRRVIFNGLLQCMRDAVSSHQLQIGSILNLESVNQVRYPDRRAALKGWNRGTRVFLRNLKEADTLDAIDVEQLLLDLEICLMNIFDPNDLSMHGSEEFIESQSIAFARFYFDVGDYAQCRDLCHGVVILPWCTIYGRCGAEAMLFALDKDVFVGWDERKAKLGKTVRRMEYCRAQAPATWTSQWEKLKRELMEPASRIPRPPDPMVPIAVMKDINMTC